MKKEVKRVFPLKDWSDVTVDDFQAIYELEREDPEDRLLRLIALVNGVGMDVILNMPISRLEGHYGDIDFLQREPKSVLVRGSYLLGGVEYCLSAKEMTTAQYIDFKQMVGTYSENLARFLTIFLIPKGHRYGDGYDLEKAAQDIGGMSITDARAVCAFFLTLCGLSMKLTLRSSVRRLRRMVRKAKDSKERELLQRALREITKARQHTIG